MHARIAAVRSRSSLISRAYLDPRVPLETMTEVNNSLHGYRPFPIYLKVGEIDELG
jgi:hypothetical protein